MAEVRRTLAGAVAMLRDGEKETKLLSLFLNGTAPWIDPAEPITEELLAKAAEFLGGTPEEIRSLYAALAPDFKLRFG